MSEKGYKRKLTAILSADVKGYSRLMGEDEAATVAILKKYRDIISSLVEKHSGRVVDSPGDNLLAEFGSVVDAVECAVTVQKTLKDENASLPEDKRMEFRIGVNLGDVIDDEGRIYGDGVNVAARVEGLAEGGGICISGTAFDQIGKKLPLGYEFLGEQEVKNIEKPVRAYKVRMDPEYAGKVIGEARPKPRQWQWAAIGGMVVLIIVVGILAVWHHYLRPDVEPASVERMAYPLPDKPSIAVLPFDNMSGDPDQEYFSAGITEEIITGLSKVPRLFVIARNSTFTYKGKPVKVQQVAEELGVQYVLEGSVQKANDRVRITAQLVDATTGKHLWAEKYDRGLKDIFALQDEIMMKVIAALQVKLTEGEQALIIAGGTNNFEAYIKFLQGLEYTKRFNREGNLLARKTAQEIIALDPNYPIGYRLLATTHWLDVRLGISTSPGESLAKAAELYQKVIAMDPSDAVAHGFLGMVYTLMRQHEKGIAEVEKAVTLNPNAADARCFFGIILHYNGRHDEAIQAITKAIRLNPFPPNWYFMNLGRAYSHAGQYEEAIAALQKALQMSPDNLPALTHLAATYSLSGREQEARAEAAEILRVNPKFSLQYFAKTTPHKNPADKELVINALRKAGLPETPPLPLPEKPSIAVLPFENMSGDP
ncbi:MAG: tetratricopeptide repeat protein, partial [Desulfatiglandales bacterium]